MKLKSERPELFGRVHDPVLFHIEDHHGGAIARGLAHGERLGHRQRALRLLDLEQQADEVGSRVECEYGVLGPCDGTDLDLRVQLEILSCGDTKLFRRSTAGRNDRAAQWLSACEAGSRSRRQKHCVPPRSFHSGRPMIYSMPHVIR